MRIPHGARAAGAAIGTLPLCVATALGIQFTQVTFGAPPYNEGADDPAWSPLGSLEYTRYLNS